MYETILLASPFAPRADKQTGSVKDTLRKVEPIFNNEFIKTNEDIKWKEWDWLKEKCIPAIIDIILTTGESSSKLILHLSSLITKLAQTFGNMFTDRVLIPEFEKTIQSTSGGKLSFDISTL